MLDARIWLCRRAECRLDWRLMGETYDVENPKDTIKPILEMQAQMASQAFWS
jgi:hypothetical protein